MKLWGVGLSAAALLGGALAMGLATEGGDRLAPGLRVAGVDVGGLSQDQALAALSARAATPPRVTVQAGERRWTVEASRLGWQADARASLEAARRATQNRSLVQRVRGLVGQAPVQELPLVTRVDPAAARAALGRLTAELNTQPRDAAIVFDKASKRFVVTPDAPGRRADAPAAAARYAADPALTTLSLPVTEWKARYTAAALRPHAERGNALMRPFTVRLEGTDRRAGLTALQVANLYWVRPGGIEPDEQTLRAAFDRLTAQLDRPAQNARFTGQGGKLVKVAERAGRVTARPAALAAFRKAVLDPATRSAALPGKVSRPTLTLAELPDPAGLKLIASGKSTYFGSSPERRVNVANAAARIHGMVVPAGEDFSFLTALGSITSENGFVGGLIISGGRTVDGLGGGVCQVSTTVFRALYQAGLPVVERHQHSYRVGYYEPQVGFEAAVYDPGLDLRLNNDTRAPIFIKTLNDEANSTLEVQVWGIKPQRQVTVSPATILARTPHPPAQYVFNPNLPAGAVRQVDWAQDGYQLHITRTIKDAAGTRTDQVDTVYKPWRAVFETGPRG
ncbi:VanW family protein [Deinococcus budaensis]|uniref:Vancomycin resistance protein YoaR n=1 Tax=Deinococcus budaensis TaxID=1665626 RepID=A0A7W8LQX0_9DEIO|nr:VanW family protein [Deinococcus budaensis]MBB5235281.1 vancomycin resistance protein YoaR [Deinococcus budaensis]